MLRMREEMVLEHNRRIIDMKLIIDCQLNIKMDLTLKEIKINHLLIGWLNLIKRLENCIKISESNRILRLLKKLQLIKRNILTIENLINLK